LSEQILSLGAQSKKKEIEEVAKKNDWFMGMFYPFLKKDSKIIKVK